MIREELNKLGEDIDGPEFRSSGGGKKKKRMKRFNKTLACVRRYTLFH